MENITTAKFGEVSSLRDVLEQAKKKRKGRQPQFILLVEDDPITNRIVANSFKEHYAMICSKNAQEAVADYMMYAPDVVFLDIGLPDASGFDVLDLIIACDPDAYVVMFSSNKNHENISNAVKAGASGFVGKPFKKDDLHEYIISGAIHHNKKCE